MGSVGRCHIQFHVGGSQVALRVYIGARRAIHYGWLTITKLRLGSQKSRRLDQ